ncbi:L-serine ammonia-lyase [Criblamydia sequanensis]|uniref:L-serine dehydratase n=1 Tax=Candidatus Criblamydia sequanensis CRIB-18 TaxID=1437425 RepID=A0A090D133_9BACT|nr:L-serine ammonia-lyase [Criblamydia sequanensis]CDR33615.1 L-serine ammonia-lyase [Criblamydia sequanensis CRIB-18]
MAISIFNLFSIGIGPSSSHTVGPMRASLRFSQKLQELDLLKEVKSIRVELFGSLALTGKGHGTDKAILLGLGGETPQDIDPNSIPEKLEKIRSSKELILLKEHKIAFNESRELIFHKDKLLPYHPNGMRFTAFGMDGILLEKVYYSVGGGFVVEHDEAKQNESLDQNKTKIPYPFKTAEELLKHCQKAQKSIAEIVLENEKVWRSEEEIREGILHIWEVMQLCVKRGCEQGGILPGGLNLRRRAKNLYDKLSKDAPKKEMAPSTFLEWVSLWALAVNEENAAGGRVVTAPTNGAAGGIPAVLHYYAKLTENPTEDGLIDFFLTATAIGILYKEGASISAAEMGCMGEVGVACSMAAAGLTAALKGTPLQIENAAEIGMEHNLGLTCDPVMGLVQIPCIERNTMGAIKAINAAILALNGDGLHRVSLDQVINTMRQTGRDMQSIYKETSLGGLAANVPEC